MNGSQALVREERERQADATEVASADDAASDEAPSDESSTTPRPSPLAWVLLLPVRFYRKVLSPLIPPSCRFYPSCSAYAVESLTRHGALRGVYLTLRRLLKCGPWHPGGLDPVPHRFTFRTQRPDSSTVDEDTE